MHWWMNNFTACKCELSRQAWPTTTFQWLSLEYTLYKMDNLDATADGSHFDSILEANPFADVVSSSTQPLSSEQHESALSSSLPTTVSHEEPEQPPPTASLSSSPVSTHPQPQPPAPPSPSQQQPQQQQTVNSSNSSISNGMASLHLDAGQQQTTTRDSLEEVTSEYSQVCVCVCVCDITGWFSFCP